MGKLQILIGALALALGAGLGGVFYTLWVLPLRREAQRQIEMLARQRDESEREIESRKKEAVLTAKEEAFALQARIEQEDREKRAEIGRQERRLAQKEEGLEQRLEALHKREEALGAREAEAERLRAELSHLLREQRTALERVAQLNVEEARTQLLKAVEGDARLESARLIKDIEEQTRRDAERRARQILTLAIQRCAVQQTGESTVSVVSLPSDELKGRIIGREGRNIRTFETLTGVDVIIDDTPEAVVLSSFDPVRREAARLALGALVDDGRIHPGRIEEAVEKAQESVEEQMREAAEQAVLETGIAGLHPELLRLVGRMRFRTSYGQNLLAHSIEVSKLAASLAAELGASVEVARRAGLLHDLGKVEVGSDQPHALISRDWMLRWGESEEAANAAGAHHNEIPADTIEAVLIQIADGISAARPGARREMLESYIRRLQALETIGDAFPGVEKTYAVQAGREVRVMVRPDSMDDSGTFELARNIARKIEEEMASQYPGQIKVTVIRETRATEYAR